MRTGIGRTNDLLGASPRATYLSPSW